MPSRILKIRPQINRHVQEKLGVKDLCHAKEELKALAAHMKREKATHPVLRADRKIRQPMVIIQAAEGHWPVSAMKTAPDHTREEIPQLQPSPHMEKNEAGTGLHLKTMKTAGRADVRANSIQTEISHIAGKVQTDQLQRVALKKEILPQIDPHPGPEQDIHAEKQDRTGKAKEQLQIAVPPGLKILREHILLMKELIQRISLQKN